MKKNFMTRVLAVALSAAMALSMATATNLTVAEAAAKPAMKSASFAVRIGNKAKNYYATAATQKAYKIVKAKAGNTDKATAKVVKSGKAVAITAGTKTGKTNITLTFKNRKTAAKKTVKFAGKVLAAKKTEAKIESIKQTATTALELTMTAEVAEIKAEDVTVVRDTDKMVLPVKAAKVAGKVITVETYSKMADGAAYTVTYVPTKSEGKFTATAGVVAAVDVTPATVTAGKETTLYYLTFDEAGIQLDKQKIDANVDSKIDVTSVNKVGSGYISGNKIFLSNVGDSMDVTVTYHSYKYENGAEVGAVTKTVNVVAVEDAAALDAVKYTILPAAVTYVNWKKYTPVTSVAMEDEGRALNIKIVDTNGDDITKTCGYTVESADNGVLLCDGAIDSKPTVTPVAQGTTYILVKNDKGATVTTLPVSVTAKRILAKVIATKTSATISTHAATAIERDSIVLMAYDQYDQPMSADYDVVLKGAPTSIASSNYASVKSDMIGSTHSLATVQPGMELVSIGGTNVKGSYTYVATATDKYGNKKQSSFNVSVKETTGTVSKALVLSQGASVPANNADVIDQMNPVAAPIDTTIKGNTAKADVFVTMNVVNKRNGVISETAADVTNCSVSAIKVKKNGSVIAQSGTGLKVITCAAIPEANINAFGANDCQNGSCFTLVIPVLDEDNNVFTKVLEPATYTVEATLTSLGANGKTVNTVVSNAFTVVDNQAKATAVILKTAVDNGNIQANALRDIEYAQFFFDEDLLVNDEGKTDYIELNTDFSDKDYAVESAKTITVKKLNATVDVRGTAYKIVTDIPVYKSFTYTAGSSTVWS